MSCASPLALTSYYSWDTTVQSFLLEAFGKTGEDEWVRVPGRSALCFTSDRLKSLAEVTGQFRESLLSESGSGVTLGVVEQVTPSLEKRCDDDYDGPGEDVCAIVNDLVRVLQVPMELARNRTTYDCR